MIVRSMGNGMVNGITATQGELILGDLTTSGAAGDEYVKRYCATRSQPMWPIIPNLLENNPYMLGLERGLYDFAPIDFTSNETLSESLGRREAELAMLPEALDGRIFGLLMPERSPSSPRIRCQADRAANPAGGRRGRSDRRSQCADRDIGAARRRRGAMLAFAGGLYRLDPEAATGILRGRRLEALEPDRAPHQVDWENRMNADLDPEIFPLGVGGVEMRNQLIEAIRFRYIDLAYGHGSRKAS